MKIVLIFAKESNSIRKNFQNELLKMGHEVFMIFPNYQKKIYEKIYYKISKLNTYIRSKEISYIYNKINNHIVKEVEEISPDVVISYNDSFLLIETVIKIKIIAKFVVYLGDNPFYSFNKKDFLKIVINADIVFTPDTGCKKQLEMIGVQNVYYAILGVTNDVFYKVDISDEEMQQYGDDVIFIGGQYSLDSWTLKRAIMLNNLTDFDLKIWGKRTWGNILKDFPKLYEKFTYLDKPMPFEELNLRMNYSRIYPIDHHPGIINGIHARVFDAISAGILPIVEYRKDIDVVFKDVKVPCFNTYSEAKTMVDYYLKNENERTQRAKELHEYGISELSSKKLIKELLGKMLL